MLIIDMPMPKCCADCPMIALSDRGMICLCTEALLEIDYDKKRPSWCPIKGVLPDEHGDLIDKDKLKRAFCNHCDGDEPCSEPCVDIGLIETAPTVIAAERKDDEQIH